MDLLICCDNILFFEVCVCVCVCACMFVCVCGWGFERLCVSEPVHMCILLVTKHPCSSMFFYKPSPYSPACFMHTYMCAVCEHAFVCVCVCMCTHTHTHTHTHTRTPTPTHGHKCVYVSCVSKARTRQESIPSDRGLIFGPPVT